MFSHIESTLVIRGCTFLGYHVVQQLDDVENIKVLEVDLDVSRNGIDDAFVRTGDILKQAVIRIRKTSGYHLNHFATSCISVESSNKSTSQRRGFSRYSLSYLILNLCWRAGLKIVRQHSARFCFDLVDAVES